MKRTLAKIAGLLLVTALVLSGCNLIGTDRIMELDQMEQAAREKLSGVVATYDGHTMKIYIDGELDATSASDTSSVSYEGEIWFPWKSAEQNLVIGGTGSYGTVYTSARRMNGLVRTANVYARALNESQIRALATPYIAT